MQVRRLNNITDIPAEQWNALEFAGNPFLRHEFLAALEHSRCVSKATGWTPCHIVACDDNDTLAGAIPLYLKTHSYGEYVFDWSRAEAYQRSGLPYYPKLLSAVPFSPVAGPRLLTAKTNSQETKTKLMTNLLDYASSAEISSLHILFPNEEDQKLLADFKFLPRFDCQFLWENQGYASFADYLQAMRAERRKKIKRERRRVKEQGVSFKVLHGKDISPGDWETIYAFYAATYHVRGRPPYLNPEFFQYLGTFMADSLVVFMAMHNRRPVAAAFCLRDDKTLYGRYWGCTEEFHSLHFEACYYQGIEYCIQNGLQRFEPGTQGEHKLLRGFAPRRAYSMHRIAHTAFREAISDFLGRERRLMEDYINRCGAHLPFRRDSGHV